MSNELTLRESAWSKIPEAELKNHLVNIYKVCNELKLEFEIQYLTQHNNLSIAENFGIYVRELYEVYNSLLEDMKDQREWVTLQVRDTYHSQADWRDSITFEIDGNQLQVRGYYFDSMLFNFPWVDNSMDHPWTPWGWKIPFFSEDLDEVHYFYNSKNKKLVIGRVPEEGLKIYNFSMNINNDLNQFKITK